jgi:hypothetical protein
MFYHLLSEPLNTIRLQSFRFFVPCKHFGSNYSRLFLYLFSLLSLLLLLLLLLLHIVLRDYLAVSVMNKKFG